MKLSEIQLIEKDEHTLYYFSCVQHENLLDGLEASKHSTISFFESIQVEQYNYRYAANKWTIKEVLQHLIDTERIFSYRALRFARADTIPLMGFEVEDYVPPALVDRRSMQELIMEYQSVRASTILLYKSLDVNMLLRKGIASGFEITVAGIGFRTIGHDAHHIKIIKERYL